MWFRRNILAIIGNILIWFVPLGILVFYILTGDEVTKRSWQPWVTVALFVVIIVYLKAFKKRVSEGRLASKIRDGRVTPIWRILETLVYAVTMVAVGFAVDMLIRIGNYLVYYIIVVGVSGFIGNVFLVIHSARQVPDLLFQDPLANPAPTPQNKQNP